MKSDTPSDPTLPTLRLRLSRVAESRIRAGHPWVYSDSVRKSNRDGRVGELAVIYDRNDRFLAVGFYDSESPIRVRVLHSGKPCRIDKAWLRQNLRSSVEKRTGLFDERTTGYRLINGESDNWPALVLDRYAGPCVLKLYSLAWLERLEILIPLLLEVVNPERLVLRLSRNVQEAAERDFGKADGTIIYGPPVTEPVVFEENGIRFEAEVIRGQKTGFFLDQRENRRRISELANGRQMLNAFSFSGGFSLYAARGGASSVTDLDISSHALESAGRNFQLNSHDPAIAACPRETVQSDVFEWLAREPQRTFDLIVLDPPSLARRESERHRAATAYQRLASDAVRWLAPGGILFSGSCSAHVSVEEFLASVRNAGRESGRSFREIAVTGHAPDHPATFPEAQYLKGIYLEF